MPFDSVEPKYDAFKNSHGTENVDTFTSEIGMQIINK